MDETKRKNYSMVWKEYITANMDRALQNQRENNKIRIVNRAVKFKLI